MVRNRLQPLLQSYVSRGFVLLIMLVYLQIISLLAMHGVAVIIYQKKTYHHGIESHQERQQIMSLLAQADAMKRPQCMIPITPVYQLARHSIQWWKRHGCVLGDGKKQAFFVREKLNIDACEQETDVYNHLVMPIYYRNTLLYDWRVSSAGAIILQDTIVVPGGLLPACPNTPKKVNAGRQMLRWL